MGSNFSSTILNLLQSLSGEFDFVVWCLLGFLDKGVKHDDSPPGQEAVKRSTDTRFTART
jgi:hypothetical protein